MRNLATALLLLLVAAAAAGQVLAPAGPSVEVNGTRLAVLSDAGCDYLALAQVVEALGGRSWRVEDRFLAVLPGDSTTPDLEFVFRADSGTVRCPGREVFLPLPPVLLDSEQLYVPLVGLAEVFPGLDRSLPLLRLTDIDERGDTVLFRLGLDGGEATCQGEVRSGLEYRVVIGARSDSITVEQVGLIPILASNGLVSSTRLKTGAGTVLQLLFRRPAVARATADAEGVLVRVWPRPDRKVGRIVLDPGHGGKDPGAVGPQGTEEKTIVFDITGRVKQRLEAEGFEVLLSRRRDEYVPLPARSKLANEAKADLFVSIHANAAENRDACGFETYFLSEAKTDWERTVAARENAVLEYELPEGADLTEELELILSDLAQNEFLTESSQLAAAIQESAVPCARVKDRGVRQANFFVLRDNYMPAVLVEVGFLSNRSEEKLLQQPQHRERLAEGVANGIVRFVLQYERRVNGS
ncbi:N-acetylmuramoyl-L-alanine amidase [candidate division WOR-3 bacterium]|nr:N-acetylmuramoyl-L-alanine amidase [candidate division WOR-3 bacterium]